MQLADSNKISMSRPSSSPGVVAVEFAGPDAQAPALIFVSTYGCEREKHGAIDPWMSVESAHGHDQPNYEACLRRPEIVRFKLRAQVA
jgi:hypothetical protein